MKPRRYEGSLELHIEEALLDYVFELITPELKNEMATTVNTICKEYNAENFTNYTAWLKWVDSHYHVLIRTKEV